MWKNGNLDELKKLYGSQRRILDYSFLKYYFFDSHYANMCCEYKGALLYPKVCL